MPTEPTHLNAEELDWLNACKDEAIVVTLFERLDAARRELAERDTDKRFLIEAFDVQLTALHYALNADEPCLHPLIRKKLSDAYLKAVEIAKDVKPFPAPPSEHSEGKQEPQ